MEKLVQFFEPFNVVSILLVAVFGVSIVFGALRGATGSARRLFAMLMEAALIIVSIVVSWRISMALADLLRDGLVAKHIQIPEEELGVIKQLYYTGITGLRDFSLFRVVVVFLVVYLLVKWILDVLWGWVEADFGLSSKLSFREGKWMSAVLGGLIGMLIGGARALVWIGLLYVLTILWPQQELTRYIEASNVYKQGAERVIAPLAGDFLAKRVPVISGAFEVEFNKILQRKYEVIDSRIPEDIAAAAAQITSGAKSDEAKARALYQWVGTRIEYDNEKVRMYEEEQIWLEQSPEDTFASRKGVCIDYSRLYAVMARSVDLDVKIITGLGYDGRGGYGSHAWNEVYLSEENKWIPLDATWVSSGENWFNSPDFYSTHIEKV